MMRSHRINISQCSCMYTQERDAIKEEKGYNLLIQEDAALYSVLIAYSTSLFA